MKHVKIPYFDGEYYFEINPFTGNLIRHKNKIGSPSFPKKVIDALFICDNPYLISPHERDIDDTILDPHEINTLRRMHNMFMKIGNKRFYFSLVYSKIKKNIFDNTKLALSSISTNITDQIERRNELCLQRSLLAVKTSKSFRHSGVLFIGASLPTGNMHAWIIESNCNPDRKDREWIMYRPLIAYYY